MRKHEFLKVGKTIKCKEKKPLYFLGTDAKNRANTEARMLMDILNKRKRK